MPSTTRSARSIARANASPARRSLISVSRVSGFNARIDAAAESTFGSANGCSMVRDLSLKVRQIDGVVIGEDQMADAGGCEIQRNGRAEPAKPDDQHGCRKQPLLPLDVDLGQHDLAAVAKQLIVVHRLPSVTRSCPARSRCDLDVARSRRVRTMRLTAPP